MRRIGFLIVLLAGAAAGPRVAGALPSATPDSASAAGVDYPAFAAPDTVVIEAERDPGTEARLSLLRPAPAAADAGRLGLPSRLPGLEREPIHLSPFARTIYAADRGANTGLFLGGLGNLLGLWDEDTALAIMGAGAALGTILHGAQAASGDAP